MIADMEKILDNFLMLSQKLSKDISLKTFIDCFPYPILIYAPDGMPVMVNQAFLKSYNIDSADKITNKYNVFKDCQITTSELLPYTKRVFIGETFFKTNIKAPLEDIFLRFEIKDLDIEAMLDRKSVV